MRDQLRKYFDKHHVRLKQQWFETGLSYLDQNLPQNEVKADTEKYAQLVYDQWLHSDLTESTEPVQQFPANAKRLVIAQRVLLQVNHVLDISTPAYAQYRQRINAIDDSELPEEDGEADRGFASKHHTKSVKLHLLELTDGRSV
ncbi:protein RMI1-like protein, partial [Aphelenchoides avenae]